MKKDILSQKINRELSNLPIDTEPRVMYLLIEVRKVLDYEGGYELLRFYCNWVAHINMSRPIAQKIFDKISDDENVESSRIITFDKLREELGDFFDKHDLPAWLTIRQDYWFIFRNKLIDILVDVPVEKVVESKTTKYFVFKKTNPSEIGYRIVDKISNTVTEAVRFDIFQ